MEHRERSDFFTCNICNTQNEISFETIGRENSTCGHCHSNERARDVAFLVLKEYFPGAQSLSKCVPKKEIKGIGLSDTLPYRGEFSRIFDYQNTYYHQDPQVDIMNIPHSLIDTLDFLVSSDVFEHVLSPVQIAFDNVFKVLKKGGLFVFTVPFKLDGETEEHFPDLFEYTIVQESDGYLLKNTTRDGVKQEFRNLVFHGGPGETLELRLFSELSILRHLQSAGFSEITFHRDSFPQSGILHFHRWSVPITAKK